MPLREPESLDEIDPSALAELFADLLQDSSETSGPDDSSDTGPNGRDWLDGSPAFWLIAGTSGLVAAAVGQTLFGVPGAALTFLLVIAGAFSYQRFRADRPNTHGDDSGDRSTTSDDSDRRITAIGRLDLIFDELPADEGRLLTGPPPLAEEIELEVPQLNRPDEIRELADRIDKLLSEAPKVLGGDGRRIGSTSTDGQPVLYGREEEIHEALGALDRLISDRVLEEHRLDLVSPAALVREFLVEAPGDEGRGVNDPAREIVDRLRHETDAVHRRLDSAKERWRGHHDIFHALRISSLAGTIAPLCHKLGDAFHYSSFNLYCPGCNDDRIEALLDRDYSVQSDQDHPPVRYPDETRCHYEPKDQDWRCQSCDRVAENPIPIHKSLDEIFLPVYNRLMDQHKNERLEIYSRIRDQELDYMNQCRSEIEEVARSGREAVEELETRVVQAQARIKGEEQALESFLEILESYQSSQRKTVEEIRRNTEEIRESVEKENQKIRKRLAEISQRSQERLTAKNSRLARAKKIEDEKRDAVQRQILLAARTTAAASTTTAANTSRIAADTEQMTDQLRDIKGTQERQMHIQAAMAEESGVRIGASRFDPLGKLREKKAKVVSAVVGEDSVRRAGRKEEAVS